MRRRLARLALMAVVVPVGARLAIEAADRLEERNGPSTLSRGLRVGGAGLQRLRR